MNTNDTNMLSESFKALIGNQGLNLQFYDLLPIPIEIFSPDGTSIFMNRAWLEMNCITDANLIVDKYNLWIDPVCIEIMGKEVLDRIFGGEAVTFPDFPVPIQDLVDRDVIDEKPYEAATTDLYFLPMWDGDKFSYTVCFMTVKNMYKGRADIAQAQEYIQQHWQDEFDLEKIARSVNLSRRHFQRIFKEVTGIAPMEYYQNIKIDRLKEKLLDNSLSIEQAFAACGVDYRGRYLQNFKDKVGMTPAEYRKKKTGVSIPGGAVSADE